ncbi:MAG: response regulator, partial [Candidatus Kapaibacterium sp.]
MENTKVLLVDDEPEFTATLAERLATRELEVDVSDNGADALSKVRDKNYDAVVLDMAMPGLDGIETLKLMLEKNPDLQIIFLTGYATVEKSVEAIKLGAKDFLEKPVDIAALYEKIKNAKVERMILTEKKLEEKIKNIMTKK